MRCQLGSPSLRYTPSYRVLVLAIRRYIVYMCPTCRLFHNHDYFLLEVLPIALDRVISLPDIPFDVAPRCQMGVQGSKIVAKHPHCAIVSTIPTGTRGLLSYV